MAKLKTYTVYSKLQLEVSTEINASSLIEAAEKTQELKEKDFVTIKGEYLGGNMNITGVFTL